jgi:tryptophan synthase alpha chain
VTSVEATIRQAVAQGRAALVGYLPAGFPTMAGSVEVMAAMVGAGVDVVEIGLPYSDPVMDGPTIQAAAETALAAGTRTADVFRAVDAVAKLAPTLVMTYWNPVERYGVERFATALGDAGGAGLITPDLIPDEAVEWVTAADRLGLDRVFLVAPTSSTERLRTAAAACRGFVYAAALMGVTGVRESTSAAGPNLVNRVRQVTDLPVGVGIGVATGSQAAEVASYADAVIVGSAIVSRVQRADSLTAAVRSVEDLVGELARGVRGEL